MGVRKIPASNPTTMEEESLGLRNKCTVHSGSNKNTDAAQEIQKIISTLKMRQNSSEKETLKYRL